MAARQSVIHSDLEILGGTPVFIGTYSSASQLEHGMLNE